MKRLLIVLSVALLTLAASGQVAFAGEWNKQQGDLPAKEHAHSECAKNGLDQPDAVVPGDGGEESPDFFSDDKMWALGPAHLRVQSGGQMFIIVRENPELFAEWPAEEVPFPGVQGFACNPTGKRAGFPGP